MKMKMKRRRRRKRRRRKQRRRRERRGRRRPHQPSHLHAARKAAGSAVHCMGALAGWWCRADRLHHPLLLCAEWRAARLHHDGDIARAGGSGANLQAAGAISALAGPDRSILAHAPLGGLVVACGWCERTGKKATVKKKKACRCGSHWIRRHAAFAFPPITTTTTTTFTTPACTSNCTYICRGRVGRRCSRW
jgi:hypothetical protein